MSTATNDALVSPIPDNAPTFALRWNGRNHTSIWTYTDEVGRKLFHVCRFDRPDGGKDVIPATLWYKVDGTLEWRWRGYPAPRPLYKRHELIARPDLSVLVVEGERAADAATAMWPEYTCLTSPGGVAGAKHADWSPLMGRDVVVWPDNDDPGAAYARDVTRLALNAGASSVRIVTVPRELPKGWDLADDIPDGVDHDTLLSVLASGEPVIAADAIEEVRKSLEGLIDATSRDPGAAFAPEALNALTALKDADLAAFERLRAQLKSAGCRVVELDRAIAKESGDTGRDPKQADVLIDLALSDELFHSPDGTGYARVDISGHYETLPIRSKLYKRLQARRFFEAIGGAPNSEALQAALNVLEARAHFEGPEHQVHVRVGQYEEKLYIDLCDSMWRAIQIDVTGWQVISDPPIRFRRSSGMKSLPVPVGGSSIEALRPFLNVRSGADFVLVVAWLLAALRSPGPYPVLVLSGEQGSAKSTFARFVRDLTDPNTAALRALPHEERHLFIAASNAHVLAFDNVSTLASWLSDAFCRLATGGGFAVRQLYSDVDEVLFDATRPVVLNGIVDFVTRADLGDRALSLTLEPIAEERRRSEHELLAAFEVARPGIFGALLDILAHGMRMLPETRLEKLPRMADFALWATACETAFAPPGTFWAAYTGNRDHIVDNVIDADPVAAAVRSLMTAQTQRTVWTGTATDLLAELTGVVGERAVKSKGWPSNARDLSAQLRRASPFLRKVGIEISFGREGRSRTRTVTISKPTNTASTPDNTGEQPSAASASSAQMKNPLEINDSASPSSRTLNGDANHAATATVRINAQKFNDRTAADAADAGSTHLSVEEKAHHGWSGRI